MKKLIYLAVTVFFIFILNTPSFAVSDEEALQIKKSVADYMNNIKYAYNMSPEINIEYLGEVKVTPKNNYYEIMLPKISFNVSNPQNPADELIGKIDPIIINASQKDDDIWAASFSVPSLITATNGNDKEVVKLEIGSQRASVLFMPKFLTAIKYDISYKDIVIYSFREENSKFSVGEIISTLDLKKQDNGFWTGPSELEIKNIGAINDNFQLNIENIGAKAFYENFDLETVSLAQMKFLNGDSLNLSLREQKELSDEYFKSLLQSMDSTDMKMGLQNMKIVHKDEETGAVDNFMTKDMSLAFSAKALRSNVAHIGFAFNFDGTNSSNNTAQSIIDAVIPKKIEIDTIFTRLPIRDLIFAKSESESEDAIASPTKEFDNILIALMKVGTEVIINKINFDTRDIGFVTNGNVKITPNAALNVLANLTLKVRNLDDVIAKYSNSPDMPEQIKQMVAFVTMLQMLGSQEVNDNGENIRVYKIELTQEGKMMLNGADLSTLIGGFVQPRPTDFDNNSIP